MVTVAVLSKQWNVCVNRQYLLMCDAVLGEYTDEAKGSIPIDPKIDTVPWTPALFLVAVYAYMKQEEMKPNDYLC